MQYVAWILLAAGFFVSGGRACSNVSITFANFSSVVEFSTPNYLVDNTTLSRNMFCSWVIGPSDPNAVVGLEVVSANLPKWSNWTNGYCPIASLIASEDPSGFTYVHYLLVTACGSDIPRITSNGRYMHLEFRTSSDHSYRGLGFTVRVFQVLAPTRPTTTTTDEGSNLKNSTEGISTTVIIIIACSVFGFILLLIVALVCCHKAWTNKLREGVSRLSANPENKVVPVTSRQSFPVLPTKPVLVEEALMSDPQPPDPGTASVEPVTETVIPADTVTETADPAVTETADPNTETADTNTETADPVTETADPVNEAAGTKTESADPVNEAAGTNTETADPVTETADPVNEAAGTNTKTADPVTETADPVNEAAVTNTETTDPVNEAAGTNVQTDEAV